MPNYSISVNSTFQPFTYQELVAPILHQQQVFDDRAEQFEKLSSQADILEAMGENDRDKKSKAYSDYKSYSDSLKETVDNFYATGLENSRQALWDLRRRYNKEIVPIQNAWTKREKEAEAQQAAYNNNPSLMFKRVAKDTPLDYYINNPTGGYEVINGANITTQMASMAKNLEKQILNGSVRREAIDGFTYDHIKRYGLDANIIRDWRRSPTLTAMYQQVMKANGVTEEALQGIANKDAIIDQSTSYAEMGMWNAMGQDVAQKVEDFQKRTDYQAAKELSVYEAKKKIDDFYGGGSGNKKGSGNNSDDSDYTGSGFQLPVGTADFSDSKNRQKAMESLGYLLDKNTNTLKFKGGMPFYYKPTENEIQAKRKKEDAKVAIIRRKQKAGIASPEEINWAAAISSLRTREGRQEYKKVVSLYDKSGNLLNRDAFVKQAENNPDLKKQLENYYDDKITPSAKILGVNSSMHRHKIEENYNTLREHSASRFVDVHALNIPKDDFNPTASSFKLKRIINYRGGTPVFDSHSITLHDLLNKKNTDKTDTAVASYLGEINGERGLIFATTIDNKGQQYFIPMSELVAESNMREANEYINRANEYRKTGNTEEEKEALEIALGRIHLGLTHENKGDSRNPIKSSNAI
jgi:hypothetical protein